MGLFIHMMMVSIQCLVMDIAWISLNMVVELVVPVIAMIGQGLRQMCGVRGIMGRRHLPHGHKLMTFLVVQGLVVHRLVLHRLRVDRLVMHGFVLHGHRLVVHGHRLRDRHGLRVINGLVLD
jgi:hypothetical protein